MRIIRPPDEFFHYGPPEKSELFDELIRPICDKINSSGYIWTVESCQGHESIEGKTFDYPFIRLVTHTFYSAKLIKLLTIIERNFRNISISVGSLKVNIGLPYMISEEWFELYTWVTGDSSLDNKRMFYKILSQSL